MVYITGDIHGSSIRIYEFAKRHKLTKKDVIIILGDVGANYYGDERDERTKENLTGLRTAARYDASKDEWLKLCNAFWGHPGMLIYVCCSSTYDV